MRRALIWILAGLLALSCERPSTPAGPRYRAADGPGGGPLRLAIHPLYNPNTLAQVYGPLIDLLNQRLGGERILLEASRDYADFEHKLRLGQVELLLPNPWQTLQAIPAGYTVVAMAGEPEDFRGLFIARSDSPLKHPADLRGQVVAYPAPTALAACIMTQWFLHEQGLNPLTELDNRFVGSQESAILNAYMGLAAVGVTWPPPWRRFREEHPEKAAELVVLWQTAPLPSNSVMVRNDLLPSLGDSLCTLLTSLELSPEGRAALETSQTGRFLKATNEDYLPVQAFITRFEREVRPVESP